MLGRGKARYDSGGLTSSQSNSVQVLEISPWNWTTAQGCNVIQHRYVSSGAYSMVHQRATTSTGAHCSHKASRIALRRGLRGPRRGEPIHGNQAPEQGPDRQNHQYWLCLHQLIFCTCQRRLCEVKVTKSSRVIHTLPRDCLSSWPPGHFVA